MVAVCDGELPNDGEVDDVRDGHVMAAMAPWSPGQKEGDMRKSRARGARGRKNVRERWTGSPATPITRDSSDRHLMRNCGRERARAHSGVIQEVEESGRSPNGKGEKVGTASRGFNWRGGWCTVHCVHGRARGGRRKVIGHEGRCLGGGR